MTEQRAGFRFDIYERVQLSEDRPAIGELEQIELLPFVKGLPGQEQTQLKGYLQLSAVYAPAEAGGAKQTFDHFIPVEISLPVRASLTDEDVQVRIEQFDVELISNRSLNVTGVLSLSGWRSQALNDKQRNNEEEIVAIHQMRVSKPKSDQIKLVTEHTPLDEPASSNLEHETQPLQEVAAPVFEQEQQELAQGHEQDHGQGQEQSHGHGQGQNQGKGQGLSEQLDADYDEDFFREKETEPPLDNVEPKVAFRTQPAEELTDKPEQLSSNPKKNNELEWRKLFFRGNDEDSFKKLKLCIVQKEETIHSIADRYQLNAREIALYNRISENEIAEGQIIYIPSS